MVRELVIGVLTIVAMTESGIAVAQDSTDISTQTATGCLQKTQSSNVYTLTDENGKLWDLRTKTVQLDPQVGHTVTVTGTIPEVSKGSNDTSPRIIYS